MVAGGGHPGRGFQVENPRVGGAGGTGTIGANAVGAILPGTDGLTQAVGQGVFRGGGGTAFGSAPSSTNGAGAGYGYGGDGGGTGTVILLMVLLVLMDL